MSFEHGSVNGPGKILFVGNTGFSLYHFRLPLMQALRGKGWEVVAIAKDEGGFRKAFEKEGIRFISVPMDHKGQNPARDLRLTRDLTKIYRAEHPAIVHQFTIKPVIFGTLAAKCARVPMIVDSMTGLGYAFESTRRVRALVVFLYRLALAGRPRAIFQNRDDLELFARKGIGGCHRYLIRGSGVDTDRIRPVPKTGEGRQVRFLLVGRMLWSKGVREFVAAAEMVAQQLPDVSFLMAGGRSGGGAEGNPDAAPVKWLEDVNKRGVVKWIGRIPFEEVLGLLDDADVAVLPSYREGLPRSLLDAAAKGRAIIATDTPGCREVVKHGVNGLLVPIRDAPALAKSMMTLARDPALRRKMGTESRAVAVKQFDIKRVIRETMSVYGLGRTSFC